MLVNVVFGQNKLCTILHDTLRKLTIRQNFPHNLRRISQDLSVELQLRVEHSYQVSQCLMSY